MKMCVCKKKEAKFMSACQKKKKLLKKMRKKSEKIEKS